MPKSKNVSIKYTSRDFESIKEDLIDHAKRFYPENYKDFTTPSFGSMILDSVSYVGDILSYYTDYAVNESFLDSAVEFNNIRKHARSMGYNFKGIPSSFGVVAFFILCPANSSGTAPDFNYLPTLKKGTTVISNDDGNFILTEDVVFNDPNSQFVAARQNPSTGANTFYAVKAYGQVKSGILSTIGVSLLEKPFKRFRKIKVGDSLISEILSVVDNEGNKYYEVDNLAQEVIFVETTNKDAIVDGVRSILKPFVTTRKYTVYQDDTGTYLQFGFGSENDDSSALLDPSKAALKMHGKNTISDLSFDPTKLLSTNKLGISPYNTDLRIIYRTNDGRRTTVSANSIRKIGFRNIKFEDESILSPSFRQQVVSSLECINEEPITSTNPDVSGEELKERARAYYAAQNRAVTKQDYESLVYQMPPKFGAVTRANVINDPSSTNREISLYVISQDSDKHLTNTHRIVKNNIKNYLSHYIPINDSVVLKDPFVVNIAIDFTVLNDRNYDTDEVLFGCHEKVKQYFQNKMYIGEPLYLTKIYETLNTVPGVYDVKRVKVRSKTGGVYSSVDFNIQNALSKDGTYYKVPKNVILELKYPNLDIKGTIK